MSNVRLRLPIMLAYAVACTNATACYSYVPLTTDAVPRVGERVRLELTTGGTTELARYLGPSVIEAEGPLSSVAGDGALTVAVDFVKHANGIREPWSGEGVVTFPRAYVAELRGRQYQRRRSIVGGVALTGALVTVAAVALKGRGAGGSSGGGPPPPP